MPQERPIRSAGLAHQVIVSARKGEFDVLLVGYVSRFLRTLKQTLIAVEDHLHAAGVVVFSQTSACSHRIPQLGPVRTGGP